jgi:FkbM family methyltransferase
LRARRQGVARAEHLGADDGQLQDGTEQILYDQGTEIDLLIQMLKQIGNKVVVDVGAEKGTVVHALLRAGAEAVYAFEPFPPSVEALRTAFAATPSVHVFELALGADDGSDVLQIVQDKTGDHADAYHSLVPFDETPTLRIDSTLPVQRRSLGSLVAAGELPEHVGILKVDTERNDLAVLRGMGSLQSDVVMLEYWDDLTETVGPKAYSVSEVADLMRDRGYTNYVVVKRHEQFETLVFNDDRTVPGDWGNLIFVHDAAFPGLSALIYRAVASAQTNLMQRSLFFANEAEKRLAIIERDRAAADTRSDHQAEDAEDEASRLRVSLRGLHVQLEAKEQMIADLSATAQERLRLVEASNREADQLRAALGELSVQLEAKERVIDDLSATAQERLRLVEASNREEEQLRAALDELSVQSEAKARVIASLTASAEERLRLVEAANREAEQLQASLETLSVQLDVKDRAIMSLTASAEERLRLVEAVTEDAEQIRTALEQMSAIADERLQLTTRASGEAERLRDALEQMRAIAVERLQLAEEAIDEVRHGRERLDEVTAQLELKEQVIADLTAAAEERLRIIERLDAEAARARSG